MKSKEEVTRILAEKGMGWTSFEAAGGPAWKNNDYNGGPYDVFGPATQKPATLQEDFTPTTSRDDLRMVLERLTDGQWEKIEHQLRDVWTEPRDLLRMGADYLAHIIADVLSGEGV